MSTRIVPDEQATLEGLVVESLIESIAPWLYVAASILFALASVIACGVLTGKLLPRSQILPWVWVATLINAALACAFVAWMCTL